MRAGLSVPLLLLAPVPSSVPGTLEVLKMFVDGLAELIN